MRLPGLSVTRLCRLALLVGGCTVAILSCGREPTAPLTPGATAVRYSRGLSFEPVFPEILSQSLGAAAGLVAFERVHIVLRRADGRIALDTTVLFPVGADSLPLSLSVLLDPGAPSSGEPLALTLGYVNAAGVTVFEGGPVTVTATPAVPGQAPPPPAQIPVRYTGPGASAARVVAAPRSLTISEGQPFSFSAVATDAAGATIANTPIIWASLDPATASITAPAAGAGVAQAVRGTARIVAQLLTGPKDTVTVTVLLRARTLAVVSGNAQTGAVSVALAQPLVVKATAIDGVGVAGVSVTFAVATGGGAVGSATVTTDASGLASTAWTLGATAGAQSVTATAAGLTGSPLTFTATARSVAPVKLVFSAGPPASVGAGSVIGPVTVTALDAQGDVAKTFTGAVAIALGTGSPTGPLLGTLTATAVAGVATFADLKINVPGSGYLFAASASGLAGVNSDAFAVVPGPAVKLTFGSYPVAGAVAGAAIDAMSVIARDAAGNVATGFTGTVTLGLLEGPAGATMVAITAVAVQGVATFEGALLTQAGSYRFTATATGVTAASGPAFTVVAGPAAMFKLVNGGGQSAPGGTALAQPITVAVTDRYGNSVFIAGRTVGFAPLNGGTASPASGTTNTAGQVTTAWTLGGAAGAQTLAVSSAGLATLNVTATATSSGVQVNYTWTGAVDSAWTKAGNWSPAGVPAATDSVYIPSTVNRAIITTPVSVKHLVIVACVYIENYSTLTVSGHLIDDPFSCALLSSGAVAARAATASLRGPKQMNSVLGTGTIILSGTGKLMGSFPGGVSITGGTRTLVGWTDVNGNLTVSGAGTVLDVGGTELWVGGDFSTTSGGKLKMVDVEDLDYVAVDGNALFAGGSTAGLLTHGYLDVLGNFTQSGGAPDAFAPDATHETDIGWCASCALQQSNARVGAQRQPLKRPPSGGGASARAAQEKARLARPNRVRSASALAREGKRAESRQRHFAPAGAALRGASLNAQFEPMSFYSGTSVVSFANSGTGALKSHFGNLYVDADEMNMASDVMIEGWVDIGGRNITGANRVLTSRGADVYSPTFDGVRWVLLDGADVYSYGFDYVTFVNMDPTVDQFTVERDGIAPPLCDCNDLPSLWYWDFETVPTTGHYIRAVDTDGPTPSVLNVDVYDPYPSVHGGFLQLVNGATSNWVATFDWLGGTGDWNTASNWNTGFVPNMYDDVFIRSSAPTYPVLSSSAAVHSLTIEAGKYVDVFCRVLDVYGNVVAPVGAEAVTDGECNGPFFLRGDGAAGGNTVVGSFRAVTINGNYKVSGTGNQVVVTNALKVDGTGNLTVNGGRVDVGGVGGTGSGSFSTLSDATLTMKNSADQMYVGSGGASFNGGSTATLLTAGTLTLVNSLLQTPGGGIPTFAPSGSHTTSFSGAASAVKFGDANSWLQNAFIPVGSIMELRTDATMKGTLSHGTGAGPAPTVYANPAAALPATPRLTVSGLNLSSANTTLFWNVMLKFIDGSSNATFDAVNWRGFPAGFTGSVFEFARTTAGPYSFASHDFSLVFTSGGFGTGGAYVRNTGTQSVTFTSILASPFTLAPGESNP